MNVRPIASTMAKRPRMVILLFAIITIFIGLNAQNLYMDTDFSGYLPKNDPNLELWTEINEEFNLGDTIIILVNQTGKAKDDVRDYKVLSDMDSIYQRLYENPDHEGIDSGIYKISSLALEIRKQHAKETGLSSIPMDQGTISEYMGKTDIASMKGILYTDDYKYAVIIIQLKPDADFNKVLNDVEKAVDEEVDKGVGMVITGTIAMQKANQEQSMRNFIIVLPVALLSTSIVLFYFHRTFKGILIAFLPIAFALILTFGTLGAIAPELTIISVAIIALLMGLGVDYSIYLMNRMTEEQGTIDDIDRIEKVLKSTGKAVLLSTITTFIGFSSLMISSMSPMVTFGFGCAIGILYSFVSAIIVVPCLVILLKFDKSGKIPSWSKFAKVVIKHRKRIVLIAIFFAILCVSIIPRVQTDANYYDMTPQGIKETEAMFEYGEKFGSGGNFNAFLIETDENGLKDPQVIKDIYNFTEIVRSRGVTAYSIADTLYAVQKAINQNEFLDNIDEIIDLYGFVFDKISKQGIINEEYSKTLISVSIPVGISIEETEDIINDLNSIAERQTISKNGKISKLAGQDAVYVAVNNKLNDEQSRSMIIALILVLAVLIIIFNSTKFGLLTMVPVLFVLMWESGFLVALDIPLSPVTITVASIMIGVGIDYGVHIIHRFREEFAKGLSKEEAIQNAIDKTGLSLVEAALTTSAGIAAIAVANIAALTQFLILIVFMVSVSCIAAAMILPAFIKSAKIKTRKY